MSLTKQESQWLQLLEDLKDNPDGRSVLDSYLNTGISEYGTRVRLRELEREGYVTRRREEGVPTRQASDIWSIEERGEALRLELAEKREQA